MHDQSWRHAGGYEIDRGNLAPEQLPILGRVRPRPERRLVPDRGAEAHSVIARLAPIQKIGRRIKAGDALDGAAFALDRIAGAGVAGPALGSDGETKVSTGAAAGDAQALGIHPIVRRVVSHETDG